VSAIDRLRFLLGRIRPSGNETAPEPSESQSIDAEKLAAMLSEAAEEVVLKAMDSINEQDPTRPNMSPLAESLRDYKLLSNNIKVLSWKLSQIESRALLDEHPDWSIQRPAREVVARFQEQFQPYSRPCRGSDIYSGWHFGLSWLLGGNPLTRKVWEWTFTVQALWNMGVLHQQNPAKGIGFGCGTEPLISLLANFNVEMLATDLTGESEVAKSWAESGQNTGNLENLFMPRLVSRSDFTSRVSYRDMDMTDIPLNELEGLYDFAWSSCALEHLGSKQKGFDFILNSCRCLRPGGVAIHTTEFDHTGKSQIDNWPTVLFTQADILHLQRLLDEQDMELLNPAFEQSGHFIDGYIDIPPYPHHRDFDSSFFQPEGTPFPSSMPQLNLSIDGFKCTSYALIVRRR
jgi:hypothetical protein